MTLDEAEEFLFFLRDEMLKSYSYNAELVWKVPSLALETPEIGGLVRRWFYATRPDMRKYVETRIVAKAEEILCL